MPDRQTQLSRYFDSLYRSGQTPWKSHQAKPLLSDFLSKLTPLDPPPRVLDIGCGDGWLSLLMAKRGLRVTGLDSSPTAIRFAQQAAREQRLSVDFRLGDALDLPFPLGYFDALVDRGLFHHILPANRDRYLGNIVRVLTSTALMYLSVFSLRNPEGIGQRFSPRQIDSFFGEYFAIISQKADPLPNPNPAHLLHFILTRD